MLRLVRILLIVVMTAEMLQGQAAPATATPEPDPVVTQLRKAVTFIKLACNNGAQKFTATGTGFFLANPVPGSPEGHF